MIGLSSPVPVIALSSINCGFHPSLFFGEVARNIGIMIMSLFFFEWHVLSILIVADVGVHQRMEFLSFTVHFCNFLAVVNNVQRRTNFAKIRRVYLSTSQSRMTDNTLFSIYLSKHCLIAVLIRFALIQTRFSLVNNYWSKPRNIIKLPNVSCWLEIE